MDRQTSLGKGNIIEYYEWIDRGLVQEDKVGNMKKKGGVGGNIWRNSKSKGDLKGIMEI